MFLTMRKHMALLLLVSICCIPGFLMGLSTDASAVPGTSDVRITDVTTCSFSVVWMTDVPADPTVRIYSDNSMVNDITETLIIVPMPAGSPSIAQSAKAKGIMKVRVSNIRPSTKYYVRTVTEDPAAPGSVGYSALFEVITTARTAPYVSVNGIPQGFSNDLAAFPVYLRPSETSPEIAAGDLIVLESGSSPYPISMFAGDWITAPEGILDLNNLYDMSGTSLDVTGGEIIVLRVYRGGGLSTLVHYRQVPDNGNMVQIVEPAKGFFADFNLDGKVDDADFMEFRNHYRTHADDIFYNPDFDFVEDMEGGVDAREFSKFSSEFGRTNVQ